MGCTATAVLPKQARGTFRKHLYNNQTAQTVQARQGDPRGIESFNSAGFAIQEVRAHDGEVVRRRRPRHLHQLPHQISRGTTRNCFQVLVLRISPLNLADSNYRVVHLVEDNLLLTLKYHEI